MKKIVVFIIFAILSFLHCLAVEKLDFKGGFISDNAKILTENDYRTVNDIINELQKKTTAEIAVVSVNSLNGKSIEETAVEIGRTYKVGAKDVNNGVVLLVAPAEREIRIEVGDGLTNLITNDLADKIMQEDIIPYFKKYQYSEGVHIGVASIAKMIAKDKGIVLSSTANAPKKKSNFFKSFLNLLYKIILLPVIIIMALFGKGGSKGKFGGGGGFSGNQGATGKW